MILGMLAAAPQQHAECHGGTSTDMLACASEAHALKHPPASYKLLTSTELAHPLMRAGLAKFERRAPVGPDASWPRVMYFVGDSTIRNQFLAFCSVLTGHTLEAYSHETTSQPEAEFLLCTGHFGSQPIRLVSPETPDIAAAARIFHAPPDVVYIGLGLWLMWPVPFVRHDWASWGPWASYETTIVGALERIAYAFPPAKVAITTTHSVCKAFTPTTRTTPSECADSVLRQAKERGANMTRAAAARDCKLGFRTRAASVALNDRLHFAVQSYGRLRPSARQPALVDAFALTDGRCDACGHGGSADPCEPGDGIHFSRLLFDELELLARALV
jgi:hypothetical protein